MIERTAAELLDLLSRGEVTSEAVTAAFLEAIRQRDPKVRAFLHVDEATALERARASGKTSCVNVMIDPNVFSSGTMNQTMYK